MSNKETLQNYNARININNNKLSGILEAINNLPTEATMQDKTIEITENGTTNVIADEGYDGLNSIEVNVNVESSGGEELPAELNIKVDKLTTDGYIKEITITGTSDTLPPYCFYRSSTGADGFSMKLEKVNILGSIKNIPFRAFWNNATLKTLELQEGLERMESGSFYSCTSLNLKTLPKSVKNINQAFRGCKGLVQISLPNIEILGDSDSLDWGTFTECTGLKALWIGSSLTSICAYDLGHCTGVKKIFIDLPRETVEGMPYYNQCWSCTKIPSYNAYSINNSVVVCNDDEDWMSQEEFDAIDWSNYTE